MATIIWEHSIGNTANGPAPEVGTSFEWETVEVGFGNVRPLNGFTISMRPKYEGPQSTPSAPEYFWPSWRINSQQVTISKPKAGTKVYASAPKGYQGYFTSPGVYSDPAGIINGTGYQYLQVFDQSEFTFLEAFSGQTDSDFKGPISISTTGGNFPMEPYRPDEDPPIYPMDAIVSFAPDERESVTITYTIRTNYTISATLGYPGILEESGEHIIQIQHIVTQPSFESNHWAKKLREVLNRCFFTHHIYH